MSEFGKVFLIGAGPGDPGLFTLRGKAILERADVVVYDRLVSPAILAFCNDKAQMVDVGKMPTHHKVKQSEINKLLVKFAQEMPGATIARLKGGDPFVFGRGGEEALELVAAGVEFEIVPGVTSAISVPAYAGIPVSHRGIATSFHIITGHEKDESKQWLVNSKQDASIETSMRAERSNLSSVVSRLSSAEPPLSSLVSRLSSISGLDFEALAKCPGTLIFLMGIANMEMIARRLMECGKDPKTPLAFIEKGTTPYQRTVTCTLETAAETIVRENVTAPAITIMGGVVELGKSLAWRKNLPLSGKRLVVTRAAKQASGISAKLTALGAEVIETPMIETRSVDPRVDRHPRDIDCHPRDIDCHPRECGDLASCVAANFADLANFDVLAFTSTNGVESFFEAFFKAGLDIRALAGKKIASVGKITEKKLLERGLRSDFVPEDHTGEGLGKLLAEKCAVGPLESSIEQLESSVDPRESSIEPRESSIEPRESRLAQERILLLQGNLADETLLKLLPKATRWVVYETMPAAAIPEWKREAVAAADAVVFASSSAVENFAKAIGVSHCENGEGPANIAAVVESNCAAVVNSNGAAVVESNCAAVVNSNGAASRLGEQCPRFCFSIGRLTSATARKYGFEVVESDETTMDSLVKKIAEYYA